MRARARARQLGLRGVREERREVGRAAERGGGTRVGGRKQRAQAPAATGTWATREEAAPLARSLVAAQRRSRGGGRPAAPRTRRRR